MSTPPEKKIVLHPLFTATEISSTKRFIGAWFRMLKTMPKHESAYDEVERQHIAHFGERKFKNYDSFKRSKNHHIKNERK